jgi:hypothetical protein
MALPYAAIEPKKDFFSVRANIDSPPMNIDEKQFSLKRAASKGNFLSGIQKQQYRYEIQ